MDYSSIFDPVPWKAVGHSVLQTATLYILVMAGLRLVGRRVFGQKSPQDLIVLLLIAESCDLGLTEESAGYWGTLASVVTLLFLVYINDHIPFLASLTNPAPLPLMKGGRLLRETMRQNGVEESDLDGAARQYGLASYKDFSDIMLESSGDITGVARKAEHRNAGGK